MAELFPPRAPGTPRVFALPPGADFARGLVSGLTARAMDPQTLARTRIYVNTERARRRVLSLFEAGPVTLIPRVAPLAALTDDVPDLPPVEPPVRRRLQLAQLVRQAIAADPTLAARTTAYPLAESLADLAADLQIEGVPVARLLTLDTQDAAGHWARSLEFIRLIGAVLDPAAEGMATLDPDARMRAAVDAMVTGWATDPPRYPVIVAGSTGSRAVTADFMAAVARLPQGAVVLPGLDPHVPPEVWQTLAETGLNASIDHAQWGLARICNKLGVDPGAVPWWDDALAPAPARARLVSLALRPAPVTDQWLAEGPLLAKDLAGATQGLMLIEAPDPLAEAAALALRLRQAVAEGQTAALITPDRVLARRVTAALDRWGLAPDDSAGRPLDLTPPGVFLRLTADLLEGPPGPVALLSLLKHPLTASGDGPARGRHLGETAKLERAVRHQSTPVVTLDWLAAHGAVLDPAWIQWLSVLLAQNISSTVPLEDIVHAHLTLAAHTAGGPEAPLGQGGALWSEAAGAAALAAITDLETHAAAGGTLPLAEYRPLLRAVLANTDVPDAPYTPHPDIAIWGTLEARTQTADVLLLAGLNEGTWPRLPPPDPWLSRQMRDTVGLPLAERRIGLSAHDFQQAVGGSQVVLSRALREGEAPSVPARWVLRLTNLLDGLPPQGPRVLHAMRDRGDQLLRLAIHLEQPTQTLDRAQRPAPLVPPGAFPTELPVTQVDRLIRDPYTVYASTVLGLRPLDPLRPEADALQRGIQAHTVMQRFIEATRNGLPEDAEVLFDRILRDSLRTEVPWPAMRALWQHRLQKLRTFILQTEVERRTHATPSLLEAKGAATLEGTPSIFTVTAKADRIDVHRDGIAIYDYKGRLPSQKEAASFHKQLPLEACIALRGGFETGDAAHILALDLIGLSGNGDILSLEHDADTLARTWADLAALISLYQSGQAPMVARLRPKLVTHEGRYDHLARRGEWADGDPAEPQALI